MELVPISGIAFNEMPLPKYVRIVTPTELLGVKKLSLARETPVMSLNRRCAYQYTRCTPWRGDGS
jgi:hypothetical protein